MPITLDGTNGITTPMYNGAIASNQVTPTLGFKNKIINGAMQIWQRGTSSTSIGYQTVDRWSFYAGTSPSISQSTDAPTGFIYSASVSGTGSVGLTQKVESVNTIGLVGQSITISFWLKQTTGAGSNAIGLNLYYAGATDNWNTSTQISTTQNFTTTTGWAQYSATFSSMPSGTSNGLQVTIITNSGSAVAFQVSGVQLEVGSSATSFDYRSYGTELALCQRYYTNNFINTGGALYNTNSATFYAKCPVTMRAAPTPSLSSGSTFNVDVTGAAATTCTPTNFDTTSVNGFRVFGGLGATYSAFNPAQITSANIQASAEL